MMLSSGLAMSLNLKRHSQEFCQDAMITITKGDQLRKQEKDKSIFTKMPWM